MQCTGMKDRNENSIYEGDIVKVDCGDNEWPAIHEFIVCWQEYSWVLKLSENKASGWEYLSEFEPHEIEVVENIYEKVVVNQESQ